MNLYQRRKLINAINIAAALAVTGLAFVFLGWLLWTLVAQGAGHLNWTVFSQPTPAPGSAGGLRNAISGTLLLTGFGVLIGTPVGVFAGTYLAEYGRGTRLAYSVRFVNDVLLSAPSIVVGVFVYQLFVVPMGHFSGWAGSVALALIVIPVVVATTDDMLRLVPDHLREAAAALGAPRHLVIVKVVYRAARAGIATGVLLATARIAGETAPLLFTALNNQFSGTNMNGPIANLPVVIFNFAMSPYDNWQGLAWAGALLITASVLVMNIVARVLLRNRKGASL